MPVCHILLLALALTLPSLAVLGQDSPRERVSLDADWRFLKGDVPGGYPKLKYENIKPWFMATGSEFVKTGTVTPMPDGNPGGNVNFTFAQSGFDDSKWRQLNLPHDVAIEGPFQQKIGGDEGKRESWGPCWYRKHFNVSAEQTAGKTYIDFDGVMSYAMVWVNGKYVGGWPYGYASWELDLSPYVQAGDNVIAVRVANGDYASRWYPGEGIYRNAWLVSTSPTHVAHWGVYVTTPDITDSSAKVQIEVHLQNGSNSDASVRTDIYAAGADGQAQGNPVATSQPATAKAGDSVIRENPIDVAKPNLWSLEKPNLYVAVTTLSLDNKVVDRYETPFGIRTIKFDSTRDFSSTARM